jgi:hypothetical protein
MPATVLTGPPLGTVRQLLHRADTAVLAVSYLRPAGVGLLADRMAAVGQGRLLVATDRVTTADGIAAARARRFDVRGRTTPSGGYHAKVWFVTRGGQRAALIGSGNCTGGLAVNDEAHTLLQGDDVQDELGRLETTLEGWWDVGHADPASLLPDLLVADVLDHDLWAPLDASLTLDPSVETATGARNTVVSWDRTGFRVRTGASDDKGTGAPLVPDWMVEVVHTHLRIHGHVSSATAQGNSDKGGLNVKRSGFVLGLLARHPDIEWADRRRGHVALRLR